MFVYRVFEKDPPQTVIVQQSENAYRWLRDAEIAAIHQLGFNLPLGGSKQNWQKNGFIFFSNFDNFRLEIIETFVLPIAPFSPPEEGEDPGPP